MAVSPRVLWGNVASAVNGAAAMIAAARPDLAGPAAETAAAMLASPALVGTFQGRPLRGFRRRELLPHLPAVARTARLLRGLRARPVGQRSGRVREDVQDRLAVLVELGCRRRR